MNKRIYNNFLRKILFFLFRCVRGIGNRLLDKQEINPRLFSNKILRKYAPLFAGSVINVSGWDDRDREGNSYRGYFKNCDNYSISNAPIEDKGINSIKDGKGIEIGLMKPLSESLKRKFDVVFNHTTLEHIFDIQKGFENICDLSKDAIILIVPVSQNFHIVKSYGDYWRMTLLAIAKLFKKHGFEPLVITSNDQPFAPIYCLAIGVRDPQKYKNKIEKIFDFNFGQYLYGTKYKQEYIDNLLNYA